MFLLLIVAVRSFIAVILCCVLAYSTKIAQNEHGLCANMTHYLYVRTILYNGRAKRTDHTRPAVVIVQPVIMDVFLSFRSGGSAALFVIFRSCRAQFLVKKKTGMEKDVQRCAPLTR